MCRHCKTLNHLQVPEQLKGQERCFSTIPVPVETFVLWKPEILLKDLQKITNEEGLKPGKLLCLSRGSKRSNLRPDCSDQYLFLGVHGAQSPVQGICSGSVLSTLDQPYTWKWLNATDPPIQDVSDTLYEQRDIWTTVCLGCFSFRYLLKMVEPARTGDLTQAEQCLIPCVITSSSVGKRQKSESQNQNLDLISHCGKGSC